MSTQTQPIPDSQEIQAAGAWAGKIKDELAHVIVGQEHLLHDLLIGVLTSGHVLLEGVPGLAKSLAVSCLARAVHGSFNRLQFTPDLLPSDLVGTEIYNAKDATFSVRKGPVFANFVLADEINRAPAKVQSALLEAMQERQVSLAGESHTLPSPFLVLATQNPVEQEGTYPLPEAQVDRFMLKLTVGYPSREEERTIIERMATTSQELKVEQVASLEQMLEARKLLNEVYVDEKVLTYVVDLAFATREPKEAGLDDLAPLILYGVSPRGSIALTQAARARAFLEGRAFVTPHDIKSVAFTVLQHRVITTYEAEAEGLTSHDVIRRVLDTVPVP